MSELRLLDGILIAALGWLLIGAAGAAFPRRFTLISRVLYPAGALIGKSSCPASTFRCGGLATNSHPAARFARPALPFVSMRYRLSSCSCSAPTAAGISIYAAGYLRPSESSLPGLQCLLYHAFLASMAFVMLADDGYAFMVAWETMALTSFFLVTSEHRHAEIRRAGYLYLLIAHIGAVGILLSFGVMAGSAGDYTFDAMRGFARSGIWPSIAFLLALFGFRR